MYCEFCRTTYLLHVLKFIFALIQYQYNMTKSNALNVRFSSSQHHKLKCGIENGPEVNIVVDSNDEDNLPHKLLLTSAQVSMVC